MHLCLQLHFFKHSRQLEYFCFTSRFFSSPLIMSPFKDLKFFCPPIKLHQFSAPVSRMCSGWAFVIFLCLSVVVCHHYVTLWTHFFYPFFVKLTGNDCLVKFWVSMKLVHVVLKSRSLFWPKLHETYSECLYWRFYRWVWK